MTLSNPVEKANSEKCLRSTQCDAITTSVTSFQTQLLTPAEVAEALRITRQTVYSLIEAGDIEARRIGGQWRIPSTELDRMLEEGTKETA